MKPKKKNQTMIAQLIVRISIFALFFLGIFVELPSFLLYLFFPLIIANIVLGFINQKKDLFVNIIFLLLYPLLFVIIIEYIATIFGAGISFVHALTFGLNFLKKKK